MLALVLFYLYYSVLLLFGLCFSFVFAKIQFSKKNCLILGGLFLFCDALQGLFYFIFQEDAVWLLYPLITHLPIIIVLCQVFKRRLITALAAVTTAYLCCQPSKFIGTLIFWLTDNTILEYSVRILVFILVTFLLYKFCVPYISEIFNRADRGIYTFSLLPIGYYVYDYTFGIYTSYWYSANPVVREILPLFVCVTFLIICITYYREYALREYMEQKDQLITVRTAHQKKELDYIRTSNKELVLLRHDMRLILNNIATCINDGNSEKALELISGFTTHVDGTVVKRYCENETFNYVIAAFAAKCSSDNIDFTYDVEIGDVPYDEIMLSSILSNALDNARNAQLELPEDNRRIKLMFKHSNGKLLLSVKNPFYTRPVFADGLLVSKRNGHGYGTKSIQYTTEKLGGNCQFTVQDELFVLRVVL